MPSGRRIGVSTIPASDGSAHLPSARSAEAISAGGKEPARDPSRFARHHVAEDARRFLAESGRSGSMIGRSSSSSRSRHSWPARTKIVGGSFVCWIASIASLRMIPSCLPLWMIAGRLSASALISGPSSGLLDAGAVWGCLGDVWLLMWSR